VSAQATVGAGPYLEEVEALRKYKIDLETESTLLYEVKRITIITGQLSRD
jgi:hypothetical protein